LEENKRYILQKKYTWSAPPFKVKCLEVTEKTYYLHHVDSATDYKERITIERFESEHSVIEELGFDTALIEALKKEMEG